MATKQSKDAVVVKQADNVTVKERSQMTTDSKHREADTTVEEDLHSAGQRKVNLVWEYSQAVMSIAIVFTTCLGVFMGRVVNISAVPFPAEWWTIVGLVIGFYFGRTNHARVGGVQLGR